MSKCLVCCTSWYSIILADVLIATHDQDPECLRILQANASEFKQGVKA